MITERETRKEKGVPDIFHIILMVLLMNLIFSSGVISAERPEIQFRKQPEIQQIKPPKPVKIKLHRNNKGEYSWDITGDNLDEIVKTDKKLRKLLKIE